ISTTGHLMNASGNSKTLLALDTSRVRVAARLLSPLPAVNDEALYRVIVGGAATRDEIEESEKEIQKLTNEDAHDGYDTGTKPWRLVIGSKRPLSEAQELQALLEAAGYDATIDGPPATTASQPAPAVNNSPIRLTSSRPALPSREVVASSMSGQTFSSSA